MTKIKIILIVSLLILLYFPYNINGWDWGKFNYGDEDDEYSTFNDEDYSEPGHNPNQLKGIGSASASAWSNPSGQNMRESGGNEGATQQQPGQMQPGGQPGGVPGGVPGGQPGGQMPPGGQQPGAGSGAGMGQQPGGQPGMGQEPSGGMSQEPGAGQLPSGTGQAPSGTGQLPGSVKKPLPGGGSPSIPSAPGKCPLPHRHRKPWSLLTDDQKELFITGFQKIRKTGKLDTIAQTHAQHDIASYVHYTSLFTFYHSYLVWEVESAIRDLGNEYACFTMPYYDWTLDAGLEHDPRILNSGLGSDGNPSNGYCVENDISGLGNWGTCMNWDLEKEDAYGINNNDDDDDDLWRADETYDFGLYSDSDEIGTDDQELITDILEDCYWSQANCRQSQESFPHCCLKRAKSTTTLLPTAAELGDAMFRSKNIKEWQGYLGIYYNKVSTLFSADYYAHMANGYATDDPIFWMTHSFLTHLRTLWQDCWNYNNIPKDKLDMHYNAYHPYCGTFDVVPEYCDNYNLGLDAPMNLFELQKESWSLAYHKPITVRKMWNPDYWNVVYELGPIYENSGIKNWCSNNRDSAWFLETMDYDQPEIYNPINDFSKDLFNIMANDAVPIQEIFKTVSSLSCKYQRSNSKNSCFNDINPDDNDNKEVCADDISSDDLDDMTLESMLNMDGISSSKCLKQIRNEIYPYADSFIQVKKELCLGNFDYTCPQYNDNIYSKYEEELLKPYNFGDSFNNAKNKNKTFFAKSGWIWMIIINGALVIILAIGCGIWHCSRSKTIRIPLKDESDNILQQDSDNINITQNGGAYGSTMRTVLEEEEYEPLLV